MNIGEFEVKSGKLVVSDPCYNRDTWCMGFLDNVRNGKWFAAILKMNAGDGWGERVWELAAFTKGGSPSGDWEKTDIDVGVDSGQAGIFDDGEYQKELTEPYLQVGSKEYHDNQFRHLMKHQQQTIDWLNRMESMDFPDFVPVEENKKRAIAALKKDEEYLNRPAEPTMDWYEMCCDKTLSDQGAGVIPGGVVSRSGYGDGGYDCFIQKDKSGQIVGVKIVFISEEEFKEEEDNNG